MLFVFFSFSPSTLENNNKKKKEERTKCSLAANDVNATMAKVFVRTRAIVKRE